MPHELTVDEIRTLVDYYALSAWVSQEAGFDFVEIHGAHCYLPCEFISPLSNRRTDEYGGSLENRARFPLEIVEAIRARCGEDYPVMYRISGAEGADGGFEVEDAAAVCRLLERAGVCAISVSAGNWYALHQTIGPMFLPRGFLLPLAERIREAVDVPGRSRSGASTTPRSPRRRSRTARPTSSPSAAPSSPTRTGRARRSRASSTRSARASPATRASTSSRTRRRRGAR